MSGERSTRLRALPDCAECGKRSYKSRKDGKTAIRSWHPGQGMSAYPCPVIDGFWHIGHLPGVVREGWVSRSQRYGAAS